MNASEASMLSGISLKTVLNHLNSDILFGNQKYPGSSWYISPPEFFSWAAWCSTQGHVSMYPLDTIRKRYGELLNTKL